MPVMHRRAAQRLEDRSARFPRNRANRDRRVRRAERRCARLGNRLSERFRQDSQAIDVAQLTLICRHTERGITLGVLDTFVAFTRGKLHIRHLHIVLIIQPRLHAKLWPGPLRHHPDRLKRRFCRLLELWQLDSFGCQSKRLNSLAPRMVGIGQTHAHIHHTIGRTCRNNKSLACRAQGGPRLVRAEHRVLLIPNKLAAAMAPEVHNRRPAA